jgi:hypothetical protein
VAIESDSTLRSLDGPGISPRAGNSLKGGGPGRRGMSLSANISFNNHKLLSTTPMKIFPKVLFVCLFVCLFVRLFVRLVCLFVRSFCIWCVF